MNNLDFLNTGLQDLMQNYLYSPIEGKVRQVVYAFVGKDVYEKLFTLIQEQGKDFNIDQFLTDLFEQDEKYKDVPEVVQNNVEQTHTVTKSQIKKVLGSFVVIALTHL